MNEKTSFTIQIERQLRDKVRLYAIKKKITVKKLLPIILNEYMKNNK